MCQPVAFDKRVERPHDRSLSEFGHLIPGLRLFWQRDQRPARCDPLPDQSAQRDVLWVSHQLTATQFLVRSIPGQLELLYGGTVLLELLPSLDSDARKCRR